MANMVAGVQGEIMDRGEYMRKATRPIVTICFTITLCILVAGQIEIPGWFIGLASGVITWWFGQRTIEHIRKVK
jgi:hypothetical protein